MRVGVFNIDDVLIGEETVTKSKRNDGRIPIGDLPVDGSYKYVGGQFVPVGFGHGKVKAPAVSRDHAVYLALTALLDGRPIPSECRKWCDWYKERMVK